MKLNHKQKVKLARENITHDELLRKVSIFETAWWEKRKESLAKKVQKVISKAKELKKLKREALSPSK